MHLKRSTRTLTAWIALFAILLGAVMPAMSHALSRVTGDETRWVEVCTVAGTKLVAVNDSTGEGKGGNADLFPAERCAFCATHGGIPALPTQDVVPFALATGSEEFPRLYFHSPRPLFGWITSPSRAPPLLA
ncbi:DUF2946 domain-containing protein [Aromatoleum petrolei]|uniref:DUF2946 domain-containing protein n=1 Tax=Aromatoleum petrolei TaxID=76116 RepID=A0ABX1MI63_9RHOO|nr:DUF2946 domain-containing protein [Aromatoleum petrolei]NMF87634.1 DUF2946 domain-containing protein [Aromatoleum petrolei]QTQ38735.1 putative protein DUF2946 [Aromatoleum petrolei]